MRASLVSGCLLLFALHAAPLAAQTSDIPKLGEVIEVSIVNVDVVVTDRNGNRVHGLTKDDFEIREDGKLRPITNFAEYRSEAAASRVGVGAAVAPSAPAEEEEAGAGTATVPRTIVIFVEEMRLPNTRLHEVYQSLREFVRQAVRPGDAATVVSWANRLQVRQEFTDDIDALETALNELEDASVGVGIDEAAAVRSARAFDEAFEMSLAESERPVSGPRPGTAEATVNALAHRELVLMRRKATVLTSLMESLSGVEGKKILLMAMNRFGIHPGFEYTADQGRAVFSGNIDTDPLRAKIVNAANANGVTLYPLYPAGATDATVGTVEERRPNVSQINAEKDIARASMNQAILMNETASLAQLAEETGGQMAAGAADIARLLPRVLEDLGAYYSLAYRAAPSGTDAAHKLVVTTKNRGYTIRMRRKIVEKSDLTQMNDRVTANLFQTLEHSVLPIETETGEVKQVAKNRWRVPLLVKVPIGSLTMVDTDDGGARGAFSVYVASGGMFGVISDVRHETQPFTIPAAELERARASHFTYELTTEVDGLTDRISVGVRDEVSKEIGLARIVLPERAAAVKKEKVSK